MPDCLAASRTPSMAANPLDPFVLSRVLARHAVWEKVVAAVDTLLPPDIRDDARRYYIQRLAPDRINDAAALYHALVQDLAQRELIDDFALALYTQSADNILLRQVLRQSVPIDADGEVSANDRQSLRTTIEPFLGSQDFFDVLEAARYRVCAVWVDHPVDGPGLRGTGFLIAPDRVMTARHVLDGLVVDGDGPPRSEGGQIVVDEVAAPGSADRLAFVFDYWRLASNFDPRQPPRGVTVVWPEAEFLEWSSGTHPDDGRSHAFGAPDITKRLDCAVVRLAGRPGAQTGDHRGGRLRGWMRLDGGAAPSLSNGRRIVVLQHPAGGPQVFDSGPYHGEGGAQTRFFYETSAAGGSSGSPCFNSKSNLVGFHNAGRPTQFQGSTDRCNQGVFIAPVVASLPQQVKQESAQSAPAGGLALWSLSDSPSAPQPVLGRDRFKQHVVDLYNLRSSHRVLIVEQHPDHAAIGRTGKTFSVRILRALARGRPGCVVEFAAREIRHMAPEKFLQELGQRIGLTQLDQLPPKPQDERQATRWQAVDLPRWFGDRLEARSVEAGTLVPDADVDVATGSALGRDMLLRDIVWIAIDDIHIDPPDGSMRELLAGMMAITDPQSVVGPGLKSLRWLLIGRVPDFVRERSIEYRLDDRLSAGDIGAAEWIECLRTAWIAHGRDEHEFPAAVAAPLYTLTELVYPSANDPAMRLQTLADAFPKSLTAVLR